MRFNLQCALGFHPWAKWSAPEAVSVQMKAQVVAGMWTQFSEPIMCTQWRQERTCTLCGKAERRVVET